MNQVQTSALRLRLTAKERGTNIGEQFTRLGEFEAIQKSPTSLLGLRMKECQVLVRVFRRPTPEY